MSGSTSKGQVPEKLGKANDRVRGQLISGKETAIPVANVKAMDRLCAELLNENNRQASCDSLRTVVRSFTIPIDGYLSLGADTMSLFTQEFPSPFISVSPKTIRDFLSGATKGLHPPTYRSLMYLVDRMDVHRHPARLGAIRDEILRGQPDLLAFRKAMNSATFDPGRGVTLRGQALYDFLGYSGSVSASRAILGSTLLGKVDVDECVQDEWVTSVTAIRLSSERGRYVTSVASFGLSLSTIRAATNFVFMQTLTQELTRHGTTRDLIRSTGFALQNASNDAYFLQHQQSGGSFNITFLPSVELNQTTSSFAKGILLSFDEISLSSGLASKIAMFPASRRIQAEGQCDRRGLERAIMKAMGDGGAEVTEQVLSYLHQVDDISLFPPPTDASGKLIDDWSQLAQVVRGLSPEQLESGDRIVGYAHRPLRPV